MNTEGRQRSAVFDYRALRLLMGLIALSLPFIVNLLSSVELASISASYYTEARDALVGMLFIVSAFLWAYNGHTVRQSVASKIASLAAMLVALFPTKCDSCSDQVFLVSPDLTFAIHYGAAITLFSMLAYFCLGPFRDKAKGLAGKRGLRLRIYLVCGWVMILCMVASVAAKITLSDALVDKLGVTYWAETIALCAFGIAWIVAGKYFRLFIDTEKEDALRLFG